jgi:hypothetical protein
MKTCVHFLIISRPVLFKMRNVSDKCCRGNQYTHFTLNNFPPPTPQPPENHLGYERMCEKCGKAAQVTDDYNTANALCMLDK